MTAQRFLPAKLFADDAVLLTELPEKLRPPPRRPAFHGNGQKSGHRFVDFPTQQQQSLTRLGVDRVQCGSAAGQVFLMDGGDKRIHVLDEIACQGEPPRLQVRLEQDETDMEL